MIILLFIKIISKKKIKDSGLKSIHAFLKHEVESNKTPSIQYIFFDRDSIIYSFHDGLRDIRLGRKLELSTTFNLLSVTKTFTALAILQLAQLGKFRLNESIAGYLPSFPYSNEITIEQILNHTSGIPNPLPLRWTHLLEEHNAFDRDRFFKDVFAKNKGLRFFPGTKYSYSNLGYIILGQLIEKVSGKKYETFIKENILDKAGIAGHELGFVINPAIHAKGYQKYRSITNLALGMLIDKKKFMGPVEGDWKPFNLFYINGTPYGGLIGSGIGLVKYVQTLLRMDTNLLNEDFVKLLFTENVIGGKPTGMSLSWFTGNLMGNKYFTHAGGGGGYYVELRLYPAMGVGSAVLYNRTGMTDKRILSKLDVFLLTRNKFDSSSLD